MSHWVLGFYLSARYSTSRLAVVVAELLKFALGFADSPRYFCEQTRLVRLQMAGTL